MVPHIMSRKRTGLRNRHRNGKSTYATAHKSRLADRYGKPNTGGYIVETINGHRIEYSTRRSD